MDQPPNDLELAHIRLQQVRELANEVHTSNEQIWLQILHLTAAVQDVIEYLRSLQTDRK